MGQLRHGESFFLLLNLIATEKISQARKRAWRFEAEALSGLQSNVCLLTIFRPEGALPCQTQFMTLPSSAEVPADTQPLSAPASLD
jgi:hypothetical protein